MCRLAAVASLLSVLLVAAPASAQRSVKLRDLPPVGQVSRYRTTVQSWVRVPGVAPRDTVVPIMTETLYTTNRVVARRGGLTVMTIHFDSSGIATKFRGAPSGDLFRGVTMRQVIDSLGRRDSSAVSLPPTAGPVTTRIFKSTGGIGSSGLSLPLGPVRVGESWTDSTSKTVRAGGKSQVLSVRVTYRLERLEHRGGNRVAVLSSKATMMAGGASASGKPLSTVTARYRLDLNTSRLISETQESHTNGAGVTRMVIQLLR